MASARSNGGADAAERTLLPQLEELKQQHRRAELIQKALLDISELAGSVSELSRLYPALQNIIGRFIDARNFFVALYDGDRTNVDFVYFIDQEDGTFAPTMSPEELNNSLTGHVMNTAQPLFLTQETFAEVTGKIQAVGIGSHPVDWIGVPLNRGGQVIGALVVQSYDDSVRYSESDVELLVFVSQHIVNAFDRVKSRELTETMIRERTKQLRHINDELQEEIQERQKIESLQQALFEISEVAATVGGDMQTFYANIHDILARLLSAPNCYIAVLSEDSEHLEFPYFSDEIRNSPNRRKLGLGLTERVLRTGRAELITPQIAVELQQQGELDAFTSEGIVKDDNSWLGSPLFVEGEIAGVIAVQTYNRGASYSFKDLELLRFVSHHIAVAIERKRAAEAIQRYNQQLAEKVKERTDELNQANLHLKKQIEERKEIERKLIHDANHDSLTGLANRAMFNNRLELAIANKKRYPKHNFAVLFVDLDRFKLINDTLGHHAGDCFLIEVANRIGKCIRAYDLLARLGGDEFVILLDSFDNPEDVEEVANRVISAIANPFELEGSEMYSGASVGIAFIESGYQSSDEILRDADAAMYQAKTMGRGRYVIFDKSMRQKLLEELALENEFRRNLKSGEFECFCQPVLALDDERPLYYEYYIRWEHPKLGKIKREQFRQVAEHSGLSIDMDHFMLRNACEILANWSEADGDYPYRKVAVNMSINHLLQTKLVEQLIGFVQEANVDPSRLVLEFDEHDLNRKSQFVLPAIKKLKRAGISLVLDNFGSGLASLSYLYSYPFDFVKVDHRFVKSIPRSQRNLKLVQSILMISEHLKFKLIADGVDTQEQLQALKDIGCHYGQGKYLIKAAAVDTEESLLLQFSPAAG